MSKIVLDTGEHTNLRLYVGVVTQFMPPQGDLACLNIVALAEDHHDASVLIARLYPDWDLQSLTCITGFAWFHSITLDSNCPQVQTLTGFVIEDIKAVPYNDEEAVLRR